MKMFKKVLAGIMTATLLIASVMGVSAADSKDANVSLGKASDGYYKLVSPSAAKKEADVTSSSVKTTVAGKTAIGSFDVTAVNGGGTNGEISLVLSGLTDSVDTKSIVLAYCVNGEWKTASPKSVDKDSKTIVVEIGKLDADVVLSGYIYATVASSSASGTAPQTVGTSSTWMLWLAVALVAVGAGVLAQKKSRQ